jgi:hypothetical protein
MKEKDFVHKDITLQPNDKEWLDQKAQELGMTTNQLIRIIIKDYIRKEK